MPIKIINRGQRTVIYGTTDDDKLAPEQGATFDDELGKKLLRLFPGELIDAEAATAQFASVSNTVVVASPAEDEPVDYKTMTVAELKEAILGFGKELPVDEEGKVLKKEGLLEFVELAAQEVKDAEEAA